MSHIKITTDQIGDFEYLRLTLQVSREQAAVLHEDPALVESLAQEAAEYVRNWDGEAEPFDGHRDPYSIAFLISSIAREDIDYFGAITSLHVAHALSKGHPEFVDASV